MIGQILGNMFGTSKAGERVVDSIANGLDKLHYGEQEKAEALAKDRSEGRQMFITWMVNSQGQNIARRCIAFAITGTWLGCYVSAGVMRAISPWVDEAVSLKLDESALVFFDMAKDMNSPVMLILAFYFAAPHIGKFVTGMAKKS